MLMRISREEEDSYDDEFYHHWRFVSGETNSRSARVLCSILNAGSEQRLELL